MRDVVSAKLQRLSTALAKVREISGFHLRDSLPKSRYTTAHPFALRLALVASTSRDRIWRIRFPNSQDSVG